MSYHRRMRRGRSKLWTGVLVAVAIGMAGCSSQSGVRATESNAASSNAAADGDATIAPDPATRVLTLDNGLVVDLRENDRPGVSTQMRLAINAGSGLEQSDQSGVAHFLEHMLFNGTEQFPDNELIDVLRTFGMEFGADVNAYTSYDETVYELTVPTDEPDNVATGLDVLAQWLTAATLDEAAVADERGVVLAEPRFEQTALDAMKVGDQPYIDDPGADPEFAAYDATNSPDTTTPRTTDLCPRRGT